MRIDNFYFFFEFDEKASIFLVCLMIISLFFKDLFSIRCQEITEKIIVVGAETKII